MTASDNIAHLKTISGSARYINLAALTDKAGAELARLPHTGKILLENIAQSYERILRSNLGCMGVLPSQFKDGVSAESLGLDGSETYDINGIADSIALGQLATVAEVEYFRHGRILQMVLRELLPA